MRKGKRRKKGRGDEKERGGRRKGRDRESEAVRG